MGHDDAWGGVLMKVVIAQRPSFHAIAIVTSGGMPVMLNWRRRRRRQTEFERQVVPGRGRHYGAAEMVNDDSFAMITA